jgi:beta-lactamase superfamily II metal-dependent hydrolase
MMPQNPWQALTHYYETSHHVNEATILERLQRHGVSLDTLSEDVLQDYDMDHYDGAEAVEILAQKAGLDASSVV